MELCDFEKMTKSQLISFLYWQGFGCLASYKRSKGMLLNDAKYIFEKYGANNGLYKGNEKN